MTARLGGLFRFAILHFTLACVAIPQAVSAQESGSSDGRGKPSATWDGFYLGGHVGDAGGQSRYLSTLDPAVQYNLFDTLQGGLQGGYNITMASGIVLGWEADISFLDKKSLGLSTASLGSSTVDDEVKLFGSMRGRVGYGFGHWLLYGTGGFAYDRDAITGTDASGNAGSAGIWRAGWVAGGGLEVALSRQWSVELEYLYFDFGSAGSFLPSIAGSYDSNLVFQTVQVGLNYQFGGAAVPISSGLPVPNDWSIHAQSTFVEMGNAPFRAAYSGPNSLIAGGEAINTFSMSGFLGYRIARDTEVYYNPEWFQGFGLAVSHGVAGFPNGEAQKGGYDYPDYNTSRLFVRQTFGFGGEQEELADGPNQVARQSDVSRLTVTFGKLSIPDNFDNNAYAHDSRVGFLNYALFEAGAFDYAGDQLGFSYGGVVELNQKTWALRAGYFLEPTVANGNEYDFQIFNRGQYLLELELRYALFGMSGKLRLTGWESRCFCGSFAATLANPILSNPALDLNAPDIAGTRQTRSEYGFIANVEHTVSDDLGLFARASWQNGQTEIMQFTDIDESFSFGGVLKGTSWGRPNDTVGLAGVINGISGSYRAYLAAGGLGLIIGDGQLSYQPESIVEAYYSIALTNWAALTVDYQFVVNPAYNSVRGPVSIGALRLHVQI